MLTATLLKFIRFYQDPDRYYTYHVGEAELRRFSLSSGASGVSFSGTNFDFAELDLGIPKGVLREINIACASDNFTCSIFSSGSMIADSVDEILKMVDADKHISGSKLDFYFDNSDVPQTNKLYVEVVNNGSQDTNDIVIELAYKRF